MQLSQREAREAKKGQKTNRGPLFRLFAFVTILLHHNSSPAQSGRLLAGPAFQPGGRIQLNVADWRDLHHVVPMQMFVTPYPSFLVLPWTNRQAHLFGTLSPGRIIDFSGGSSAAGLQWVENYLGVSRWPVVRRTHLFRFGGLEHLFIGTAEQDFIFMANNNGGYPYGIGNVSSAFPSLSAFTNAIASGDLNGDGFPDFFVAYGATASPRDRLRYFEFVPAQRRWVEQDLARVVQTNVIALTQTHLGIQDLSLQDLDHDGDLDLLVVGAQNNDQVLVNAGGGIFTTSNPNFPSFGDRNCGDPKFSDFNNDGLIDVYCLSRASYSDYLLINDASLPGRFQPIPMGNYYSPAAQAVVPLQSRKADVGDWNGDGKVDLLMTNFSHEAYLILQTGSLQFELRSIVHGRGTRFTMNECFLRDMNGDQLPDVILTGSSYGQSFQSGIDILF